MDNIGVVELLEADRRPTFIIDLKEGSLCTTPPVFYNKALSNNTGLFDAIVSSRHPGSCFAYWCSQPEPKIRYDDGFEYSNFWWMVFSIRERWRVVSGLPLATKFPACAPLSQKQELKNIMSENDVDTENKTTSCYSITTSALSNGNPESIFQTNRPMAPELKEHIQYIKNIDWTSNPLGPIEQWPQDLHQLINIMLLDTRPTAAFIGSNNIFLYNLGYAEMAGKKHPSILGMSVQDAWPELIQPINACIERVEKAEHPDLREYRFFVERHGFLEETYFLWTLVPLLGSFGGFYSIVLEVTKERLAERRARALLTVSQICAQTKDPTTFWKSVLERLSSYEYDFPIAILYSVNPGDSSSQGSESPTIQQICWLEGTLGVCEGHPAAPARLDVKNSNEGFAPAFRKATTTHGPVLLQTSDCSLPRHLVVGLNRRGFHDECKAVVICPLLPTSGDNLLGFIVVGLNTRRPYDEEYQEWIQIFGSMLGTSAASMSLFQEEIRRQETAAQQAVMEQALLASALALRTREVTHSNEKLKSFQRIAEMVDVGIFEFTAEGRLMHANDAWYNLSGYPRDPLSTTSDFDLMDYVDEEDVELVREKWKGLADGAPATFEMRFKGRLSNGEIINSRSSGIWVLAACLPMFNDGRVTSIAGFTTDIRAQKRSAQDAMQRAEALIRAQNSEKRLARFLESVPVAVYSLSPDATLQYCNEKWYQLTGYPRSLAQQVDWTKVILPEDLHLMDQAWKTMCRDKAHVNYQFRLKRRWASKQAGDSPAWVMMSSYPELCADGTVEAIMGTMVEISHFKWAESVQQMRVEEALESKRKQENFVDMTSHEIRNPLSAMVQCADQIWSSLSTINEISNDVSIFKQRDAKERIQSSTESGLDAAQTIISCAAHQKRIVDDILTLSKLDSSLLLITPVKVHVSTLMQDTFKMFAGEASKADVSLKIINDSSIDQLEVDWVMMDPSRVLQVLINLITNAIKFTQNEETRLVTLSMKAFTERPSSLEGPINYIRAITLRDNFLGDWGTGEAVYLEFTVKDTGCGLGENEKTKIFTRFSQGSPRTHVTYGGSGLGLFISRELTELQGGEIGFTSQERKGSTFSFYVKSRKTTAPADLNQTSGAEMTMSMMTAQTEIAKLDMSSLSILYTEDNIVNQKVLSKQLKQLGCEVHLANHGGETLEFLKSTMYWRGQEETGKCLSVILMDIEMPVMDGLTCAKHIRKLQQQGDIVEHVPILAVSANARKEQIDEAKATGMDDVICKPFRIPELLTKLERLIQVQSSK